MPRRGSLKRFMLPAACLAILVASGVGELTEARAEDAPPPVRDGSARYRLRLRGLWVQQGYADAIRRDHSPFAASELLTGVSDLRYDSINDSLIIGVNHHEGLRGHATLLLDESRAAQKSKGSTLGVWQAKLEGYDFRIESAPADTVLLCTGFEGTWTLTRVSASPARTLQEFVQTAICGGQFVVQDSLEQTVSRNAAFYADGELTGIPPHARYEIWTDYIDDVPRMDTMRLTDDAGKELWYAWTWKPETISLYKLTGDPSNPKADSQRGALMYTLIRLTDPAGVIGK